MNLERRLAKARTALILEQPFIGTLALNMPMMLDDSIPTACTNGKWVKFNPNFIKDLCDEQLKFLVAHEVFHPMFEHMFRLNGRDIRKWNRAGDYVINQLLTDEKIGKFIEGGLLNKSIYDAGNGSTDGIYNILEDGEGGDFNGGPNDGGIGQDIQEADGSATDQEQQIADLKVTVAQAAQAARAAGKLSAALQRIVGEFLQPKVDWRDVLRRFVMKAKTDERTFARPNRRFFTQGMYLPSRTGERLGEMVVALDCSGSIGDKELNEFAAELRAIHTDGAPEKLHVIYFHHEVCKYEVFMPDDEVGKLSSPETGGTAFSPIFEYITSNDIHPVACVVLTDLCCSDFGPVPEYPVLWVSNYSDSAPWGEVVKM
jgi:predicted metal-dependent peptidase